LSRFHLAKISDELSNMFLIPSDIEKFTFDYQHSEFLECNIEMAEKTQGPNGPNYAQDPNKNNEMVPALDFVAKSLESMSKLYWLHGSTLLGWYRDCGILPQTDHMDLAIYPNQYDKNFKNYFVGNRKARLVQTKGRAYNGLQMKIKTDETDYPVNLLFMYKSSQTTQYVQHVTFREKYR
jgi:hypothetical protein